MLSTFNFLIKGLVLLVFVINLLACGEDRSRRTATNSNSNTNTDTIIDFTVGPTVLYNYPTSELSGVATNTQFIIKFDQEVILDTNIDNNISIIDMNTNTPIKLAWDKDKLIDSKTVTLSLLPTSQSLAAGTIYQVRISGIKNRADLPMSNTCIWQFETAGTSAPRLLGDGLTGPCASKPILLPAGVKKIDAYIVGQDIQIRWDPPTTGGQASYYKIERSRDNGNLYTVVIGDNVDTQYLDKGATSNVTTLYKVTAGNGAGYSLFPKTTFPVLPISGTVAAVTNRQVILLPNDSSNNSFGRAIQFTSNGKNMAISAPTSTVVGVVGNVGVGVVARFSNLGTSWLPTGENQRFGNTQGTPPFNFGHSMSFSPDGSLLAVGEYTSTVNTSLSVGKVTIFPIAVALTPYNLLSNSSALSNNFGFSVSFSPDGTTLAVSERFGPAKTVARAGNVQLFRKSTNGPSWNIIQTLESVSPLTQNSFGHKIAFSPDGTTLAISEIAATVDGIVNAGTVQLFVQNPASVLSPWVYSQSLKSDLVANGNLFGESISFSPISPISLNSTLAVGEPLGDLPAVTDAGKVHLYQYDGTSWVAASMTAQLQSKAPLSKQFFGGSLSFDASGTVLAIGETGGSAPGFISTGIVQLFRFDTTTGWLSKEILFSDAPAARNEFGFSVRFSPVGSTLAIGEQYRDFNAGQNFGVVNIFDINNLPPQ